MTERDRDTFLATMRPEIGAGGFARDDSSINFFLRVNALLEPEMTVVDLGAGRGTALLGEDDFLKRLRRLQGKVKRVIGIDVDAAVVDHPFLDEVHVVGVADPYPLDPSSVDLVVSDWVLEHVAEPNGFVSEIHRVLRPGGWFCARTPNRWGYVGLVTNLVPNALHNRVLARLWPERAEIDVFPTVYRMNTNKALRQQFPDARWENYSYLINPPPKYHGNRSALFAFIGFVQNIVPSFMKTDRIVIMRKKP